MRDTRRHQALPGTADVRYSGLLLCAVTSFRSSYCAACYGFPDHIRIAYVFADASFTSIYSNSYITLARHTHTVNTWMNVAQCSSNASRDLTDASSITPSLRLLSSVVQTGTDYGPYLINEAPPLHTTAIVDACTRRLADVWSTMRANADTPLSTFLDFCTYGHMIDNVVLIVTGLTHERDVQVCFSSFASFIWSCSASFVALHICNNKRQLCSPHAP